MKSVNMLLLFAAGAVAAPAFAHSDVAAPPAAKPKKEHKICRADPRSGSHIAKMICHTAREWNQEAEQRDESGSDIAANREATGRAINMGTPGSSPPR
ncbi:MAG: hypothetical protein JO013_06490 [Alphaproteobacteria bacterium]|nr:hypothetical protein [Alphaproteobacteria bacterium]